MSGWTEFVTPNPIGVDDFEGFVGIGSAGAKLGVGFDMGYTWWTTGRAKGAVFYGFSWDTGAGAGANQAVGRMIWRGRPNER